MESIKTLPCFYLSKDLLQDKNLSNYSISSKLMVSILLSFSDSSDVIVETTDLLQALGQTRIEELFHELSRERAERGL